MRPCQLRFERSFVVGSLYNPLCEVSADEITQRRKPLRASAEEIARRLLFDLSLGRLGDEKADQ